jgi:RNA polymerase sigma-70 factor (ECF subfamily)
MDRLMTDYWKPVFYFLRASGHRVERAEDLTQAFFLRFLEKGWIRPADQARGRFRDFLLTLLQRFTCDETWRAGAQEKFEHLFVSLHDLRQDSDLAYEPPVGETPEEAFHKQWKAGVLAAVRRNLQACYDGLGKPDERQRFDVFAAYHFVDRLEDQPTQEALAARFGVSRDQVRYALEVVQKRYRHLLRQELRDLGHSEEELDEEIRELL